VVALAVAWCLGGRDERLRERRREEKEAKLKAKGKAANQRNRFPAAARQRRSKGTFVVGAVLSLPRLYYLGALDHIHKLNPGPAG
jgi:hypothetical protein